jgi:hypothetical protein
MQRAPPPPPIDRAAALITEIRFAYENERRKIAQEKPRKHSLNLMAQIGGAMLDVHGFGSTVTGFVEVAARNKEGVEHIVIAPVEQVAFIIVKTDSDVPPREIALLEMERRRQEMV